MAFDPASYASGKGLVLSNDALGVAREFFEFQSGKGGSVAVSNNYTRELVNFLAWVESNGHALNSVPSSAVDGYVNSVAGHLAIGTRDMKRNYLRAISKSLKDLGLDWSHLHFDNEVPKEEVEARRKERAKERKNAVADVSAKLLALQTQFARVPQGAGATATGAQASAAAPPPAAPAVPVYEPEPSVAPPPFNPQPESAMSLTPAVDPNAPVQPAAPAPVQPVIYMPVPQPRVAAAPRPAPVAPQATRANLNGVLFNGPFVTIRQTSDGSVPGTMGGQQLYIARVALSEIIRQGAPEVYVAKHVLNHPSVKLSLESATATFTLHDTTAQQIEPGNFIEVSVPVPVAVGRGGFPGAGATGNLGLPQTPVDPLGGYSYPGGAAGAPAPQPQPPAAESIWMKKIEQDIAAKAEIAAGLQAQLDKERVETRRMELQQQIDRENTLRLELVELRKLLNERAAAAPVAPDLAGFARTMAEALRPAPPPPDTTKDMLLTMMKMQADQAAQQIIQMREQARLDRETFDRRAEAEAKRMEDQRREDNKRAEDRAREDLRRAEDNQKFLVGILTQKKEESDFEKMAKTMLMAKLTSEESGFDKTMKQIGQMREAGLLPDGSEGGGSLIKDLIQIAPSLMKGASDLTRANGFVASLNGGGKKAEAQAPARPQALPAQPQGVTPHPQPQPAEQAQLSPTFLAATVELYEAAKEENDEPGERSGAALQTYVQALLAEEALPLGNKQALFKAINEADAYEDLYQVAKAALVFGGVTKPSPDQIGPVAVLLHRKYTPLYALLNNGDEKVLADAGLFEEEDDAGEETEETDGADGEEAAPAEAAPAEVAPTPPAATVKPAPKTKLQLARAAATPEGTA